MKQVACGERSWPAGPQRGVGQRAPRPRVELEAGQPRQLVVRDPVAGAPPASRSRGATPGACFVNSDVIVVVNLGISALPLPDGRVVLSSAPAVVVADRLATDAAIWRAS